MKVCVIMDGMSGVTYHRLAIPFKHIKDQEIFDLHFAITQPQIEAVMAKDFDVIILSRFLRFNTKLISDCKKHGTKLIVDNDDHWIVPKHNPAYSKYKKMGKDAVMHSIKNADVVWTTTPQLQAKCNELNSNVVIIPNAVDLLESQWNSKVEHDFTIGYVGGSTHLYDVKLLEGQINHICTKNNAKFLHGGYVPMDRISMTMEKYITQSKERPHWYWIGESVNVLSYGKYYSFMDVAIAPLEKDQFNKFKSELKIVEAAAYKLPIFVSDVDPYTNHHDNKGVVFVKNNDWSIMNEYLGNKSLLKEMGEANYNYCLQHHNLQKINETRIETIKN